MPPPDDPPAGSGRPRRDGYSVVPRAGGVPASERDPLYPPAPPGYYTRGEPTRVAHLGMLLAVLSAVALACAAVGALIDVGLPDPGRAETGRTQREIADLVLGAMDRSADPCEDFYEYACGSWVRSHAIPRDRSVYQRSFSAVGDRILLEVKALLDEELSRPVGKVAVFYSACLDQAALGGVRAARLYAWRDVFADLGGAGKLARAVGVLHANGSAALWDADVGVDEKEPGVYALYLSQGGLGLPHRDDYSAAGDKAAAVRAAYLVEIEAMLVAAGRARIVPRYGHGDMARAVLAFETELANASLPPAALRDPFKAYNKVRVEELPGGMHAAEYFAGLGLDPAQVNGSVVVDAPAFFDSVAGVMQRVETDVEWQRAARAYLVFHLVRRMAARGVLGEQLYHAHFAFKRAVYGVQKLEERWKMCQKRTADALGDGVGRAYVEKYFSSQKRELAREVVAQVVDAFDESFARQEWMDDETRAAARRKLRATGAKIGYKDDFDEYDGLVLSLTSYADNVQAADAYAFRKRMAKVGGPVDKADWLMDAHEVNAYYSPPRNEIVLPAGILQQPFFSDRYEAAMNFGGIGAVIGHELSHGDDDAGHKYDETGMLRAWWTDKAEAEYGRRAQCYVDYYDTFKPRELAIHVLGNLTLGENLADINGLNVAYRAFRKAAGTESAKTGGAAARGVAHATVVEQPVDAAPHNKLLAREMTKSQLFFVAFAQNYCMLVHKEALEVWMTTDPHSPGRFRVRGALSQSAGFADAFQCKPGSKYVPEKKCDLWV